MPRAPSLTHTLRPLAVALLGLLLLGPLAPSAGADPAKLAVGAQRAVFARSGTRLQAKPQPLAKTVKTLPYGQRVRIDEIQGSWARVTAFKGASAGAVGWVRASQTVEPFALTQGGQLSTRRTARGSGGVNQADATLAGRQFDESSEGAHRKTSSKALQLAYRKLDQLVEAIQPTLDEIRKFVAEGRLGRPGGRRAKPTSR